jgi:predicted rRNA methylase YqxC with S4 and FtsJ domains
MILQSELENEFGISYEHEVIKTISTSTGGFDQLLSFSDIIADEW